MSEVTDPVPKTIGVAALPLLGAPLAGGLFAGVITTKAGVHCAVVLLPGSGSKLTWKKASAWAKAQGGELPTRPMAALIVANVAARPREGWHWTSEALDASSAWNCNFNNGHQYHLPKSYEGGAVAVRQIPLAA